MCLCLTHPSIWRIALFGKLWLVAGADFLSEKSTAGWLVADANLVWEKSTAGRLIDKPAEHRDINHNNCTRLEYAKNSKGKIQKVNIT